jgi:alpha-galactosidase
VAGEWESYRDSVLLNNPTTPGVKNAIRTTVNRLWLSPLVVTDPDVAYFSSKNNSLTANQKRILADLACVCGYKATSDLPKWLSENERKDLLAFLGAQPAIQRTDRYTFTLDEREVDFSPAMTLPQTPKGIDVILSSLIGWLGNRTCVLRLFDKLGKRAMQKAKKGL